ncbi:MAG: hypothetical protein H8D38_04320 [DPANN group archaeon]|nr:hypothetical protein [DPANN group archaeon]
MNLVNIATEFGLILERQAKKFDIEQFALYGSFARKEKNTRDIDIILIHHNPAFDSFDKLIKSANNNLETNLEAFSLFQEQLIKHGHAPFPDLSKIPMIRQALEEKTLGVTYLDSKFFSDPIYQEEIIARNNDKEFFLNIFNDALLWNQETSRFDIPITREYIIPENVHRIIRAYQERETVEKI